MNSKNYSCLYFSALALAFTFLSPLSHATKEVHGSAKLFAFTEPNPVTQFSKKWEKGFSPGNVALTHNIAKLGYSDGPWRIDILSRYDAEFEFSKSTSEFIYLTNNKLPMPTGRTFDLSLDVNESYSQGLAFNYKWPATKSLNITFGLSFLKGLKLTDGQISGSATAISESDFDFSFDLNYFYSKDVMFSREVSAPSGQGFGTDLTFEWKPSRDTLIELSFIDLYSVIYWKDAPLTTGVGSSKIKTFDANGFLEYNPVLSGFEKNKNFEQRFPSRQHLNIEQNLSKSALVILNISRSPIKEFYTFGIGYRLGFNHRIALLQNVNEHGLMFSYKNRFFFTDIALEDGSLSQSHLLGINIGFNYPLL